MEKKKNVAFICPSLSKGGAEKVVSILSQQLADYYNIFLFLFDGTDITYRYKGLIVDLEYNKLLRKAQKIMFFNHHFATLLSFVLLTLKLRKEKKYHKINCSISFLEISNIVNILSRIDDKIIVSVRSTRSLQNGTFYERMENRGIKLYRRSDKVISVSDGVKDDLIKNFGLPEGLIQTIYNPYQTESIKTLCQEAIEPEYERFFYDHKVIVVVGRLVPSKKQERLLYSISEIKKTVPDVGGVIIGSGKRLDYLVQLAKELKVDDRILFISFVKNPFKYIYNSNIYLSTSEREGFPNNIVEAMICGVPVIVVDCCSGPREIICGDNCYDEEYVKEKETNRGIIIPLEKHDKDNCILNNTLERVLIDGTLQSKIKEGVDEYLRTLNMEKIVGEWVRAIES